MNKRGPGECAQVGRRLIYSNRGASEVKLAMTEEAERKSERETGSGLRVTDQIRSMMTSRPM